LREVIADEVPLAGAICAPEGEALNGTAGVRIVMLDSTRALRLDRSGLVARMERSDIREQLCGLLVRRGCRFALGYARASFTSSLVQSLPDAPRPIS
jgi:hypothetical protein